MERAWTANAANTNEIHVMVGVLMKGNEVNARVYILKRVNLRDLIYAIFTAIFGRHQYRMILTITMKHGHSGVAYVNTTIRTTHIPNM